MNSINLISEKYIKSHSALLQNVDSQLIVAHVNEAQAVDYRTLLGKDLYNRVITEFTSWGDYKLANPTGTNPITDYVSQPIIDLVNESQNYLMYCVLTNANYDLAVRHTNKGTTQQNSENSTNVDRGMLADLETKNRSRSHDMAKLVLEFIEDNLSDYPEYNSTCETNEIDTEYMYLGDELDY